MSHSIQLRASTDNALLDSAVPSQRLIEITLTASVAPVSAHRSPLNLALVIDRSGSMAGEKLAYVKQAACHVLDLLDARDRVAIYAFDDKICRVASSKPLTAERRDDLKQRLQQLEKGGMTNLFEGWLAGAEAVATHLKEESVNRVLLLSDGQANRGKVDLEELGLHAEELYRRGVSTSTFGVGLGYNEHLLEAMGPRHGGGNFEYIDHPYRISEIFRKEFGELLTVVAREAYLSLQIPAGIAPQVLGDLRYEQADGCLNVPIGSLSSGQERRIYLQLLLPPGKPGDPLNAAITLHYVGMEDRPESAEVTLDFTYAGASEVAAAPQDTDLRRRAAQVQMATAESRALVLEREGRGREAKVVLDQAIAANSPLLAEEAMAFVHDLAGRIEQGLTEPERKERHATAYRQRYTRK